MGRLPTIFIHYGDDKHVVINIEFAKDESSILSTSNKQGPGFPGPFLLEVSKAIVCRAWENRVELDVLQ